MNISNIVTSNYWNYIWPCYALTIGWLAVILVVAAKSHGQVLQRLRRGASVGEKRSSELSWQHKTAGWQFWTCRRRARRASAMDGTSQCLSLKSEGYK